MGVKKQSRFNHLPMNATTGAPYKTRALDPVCPGAQRLPPRSYTGLAIRNHYGCMNFKYIRAPDQLMYMYIFICTMKHYVIIIYANLYQFTLISNKVRENTQCSYYRLSQTLVHTTVWLWTRSRKALWHMFLVSLQSQRRWTGNHADRICDALSISVRKGLVSPSNKEKRLVCLGKQHKGQYISQVNSSESFQFRRTNAGSRFVYRHVSTPAPGTV